MGTRERRERERAEIRRAILGAARELFIERGYEAVTMREIARRIEYSPTAIYLHFADKKAVMDAICDEDFLSLAQRFKKIATITDPVERLRRAGQAYAEFGLRHPHHYRLMFMTPHPPHDPSESAIEQGNPDQDGYAFLRWTVSEAIAAGRLRPELDDPDLVSQLVWSAVHGIVSLLTVKHDEPWVDWRPARRLVTEMCDLVVRGLERPNGRDQRS
jgi:AcrR family transcriptional regulator